MFHSGKWLGIGSLTLGVLLAVGTPAAHAQIYRVYGYGVGDVIRAQGQFMIANQQAMLMKEAVKQKKVETRRAQLDHWMWERDNLPSNNDERERVLRETLRYSRLDPPITEIWSAKALNDLLTHAKSLFISDGAALVSDPLPSELLAKINVTNGKGDGNLGLIKDGKITWPLLLRRINFASQRKRLEQLITGMVSQAIENALVPEDLEEAMERVNDLQKELLGLAKARNNRLYSPAPYLDARRFLDQLEIALKALMEPNAGDYLSGKYAAKGNTVRDLVEYMRTTGLRFAPATPGGYEAYAALHQALRRFDISASGPTEDKR